MTPLRLILVGESPGPRCRSDLPLYPHPKNSAGYRLSAMTELGRAEYMRRTQRINLFAEHVPDHRWSVPAARAAAENLVASDFLTDREVILLGSRVLAAFFPVGKLNREVESQIRPCQFYRHLGRGGEHSFMWALVPHPSGRNRWYNDGANKAGVYQFLRWNTCMRDDKGWVE